MQSQKKILYIITKGLWGGAQSYVCDLAKNIPKDKYLPIVVCGEGDELQKKLEMEGIKTIQIPNMKRDISIKNELKSFIELFKIIKNEKPDIVHLNSSKVGLLGAIICRFLMVKKIIWTIHGLASNENRGTFQKHLILILHWITILLSHKVIVVSKKTSIDIRELPYIDNKTVVIYNGIKNFDFLDKEIAKNLFREKISITNENMLIGTISELHSNKGIDIMLDAISQLKNIFPNIKYIVVGGGEKRKELEQKIKDLNLENFAYLFGKIENAKKYIKAFDIFILTSRTEALPYVLLEAGLLGMPILASRVGGIPEIVENDKSGILVYPKKEFIIDGLKILLKNKELREKFGNEIKTKIKNDFSFEQMLEKTMQIYNL